MRCQPNGASVCVLTLRAPQRANMAVGSSVNTQLCQVLHMHSQFLPAVHTTFAAFAGGSGPLAAFVNAYKHAHGYLKRVVGRYGQWTAEENRVPSCSSRVERVNTKAAQTLAALVDTLAGGTTFLRDLVRVEAGETGSSSAVRDAAGTACDAIQCLAGSTLAEAAQGCGGALRAVACAGPNCDPHMGAAHRAGGSVPSQGRSRESAPNRDPTLSCNGVGHCSGSGDAQGGNGHPVQARERMC